MTIEETPAKSFPITLMAPSLYDQLSPDRKRKAVRLFIATLANSTLGLVLFQFESHHWSLQLLLCCVLLAQVVLVVKLLNVTTINPKKRVPPDGEASPKP